MPPKGTPDDSNLQSGKRRVDSVETGAERNSELWWLEEATAMFTGDNPTYAKWQSDVTCARPDEHAPGHGSLWLLRMSPRLGRWGHLSQFPHLLPGRRVCR